MITLKRDFTNISSNDEITLICVMRDERLLIEYFIQHYAALGVTRFVFIDNDSEDDTVDYLLKRNDVNCQIYHTTESYADNEFGLTWVNKVLDDHYKDKWCVVVDIDELIMPRDGKSLMDIKSEMERDKQNVLPTCLVDFYPEALDSAVYQPGEPFASHSNYYDRFVEDDFTIYPGEMGELVVKGGMRHRVFGGNRDPVCLTKKSFFKYDFYKTHKLSVGMHWLFPRDFDHTSDWSAYKNWQDMNKRIRMSDDICTVGHFKFIKPNIYEYFNKRVDRNQDWDNSNEYRNYIKINTSSFFADNVSVQYSSVEKIYADVFDDGINRKELLIVISEQRMGTTTLCEKLDKISHSVCLYEAFEKTDGRLYSPNGYSDMRTHIEEFVEKTDWVKHNKYISFKIFRNHFIDWETMCDVLKMDIPKRVVFLKRNLPDSYRSWVDAHTTGNWGTTPERKLSAEGVTNNKMELDERHTFEEYSSRVERWFEFCLKKTIQYNIPYKEVWFGDIIHEGFNARDLITGKWPGHGKVAICVLSTNGFHQKKIWKEFISTNRDFFNVYMHDKGLSQLSDWEKPLQIQDVVPTDWADISLVRATLKLFKEAYQVDENKYFVLVSGDSIPLHCGNSIYSYYMNGGKNAIGALGLSPKEWVDRYSAIQNKKLFSFEKFAKHSQWLGLNHETVSFLLKNDYTNDFESCFAPDEYYFGTILRTFNLGLEKRTSMHAVWDPTSLTKNAHPKIFSDQNPITPEIMELNTPFLRKVGDVNQLNLPRELYDKVIPQRGVKE